MIYHLRIYDTLPGKLSALNNRFANHTMGYFKKHGIGMMGFWTDVIGVNERLTFILTYDTLAQLWERRNAFLADPDWIKVRDETEREGPLIDGVNDNILLTTPYSPEPRFSTDVQELRIYQAVPGKLKALHERFKNHTDELFRKHGMEVIGYWTEYVGTSNRLVYMLGYPSLADREKSWASFGADPVWRRALEESERDGTLVKKYRATIMRPTPYSPRS